MRRLDRAAIPESARHRSIARLHVGEERSGAFAAPIPLLASYFLARSCQHSSNAALLRVASPLLSGGSMSKPRPPAGFVLCRGGRSAPAVGVLVECVSSLAVAPAQHVGPEPRVCVSGASAPNGKLTSARPARILDVAPEFSPHLWRGPSPGGRVAEARPLTTFRASGFASATSTCVARSTNPR